MKAAARKRPSREGAVKRGAVKKARFWRQSRFCGKTSSDGKEEVRREARTAVKVSHIVSTAGGQA